MNFISFIIVKSF